MCSQHIHNHYLKNHDKFHILTSAFKRINSDLKDPAIEYFKNLIKKNNEKKKIAIEEIQKLLKLTIELVKYFEKINKFIVSNIGQVLKSSRVIAPLSELNNQGCLPSICKIDKSNLFVYGGYSTTYMTSAFIINTSSFLIQQLPKGTR